MSKIVGLFLFLRTKEMNPYCGLGVCGMEHWTLVMKINGMKVITHYNIYISRNFVLFSTDHATIKEANKTLLK